MIGSLESLPTSPFPLLVTWWSEARAGDIVEAMALATSTLDGKPSNRFVLLKSIDERGLVFFTNYKGRKATELSTNPQAAAAMFWQTQRRQVRVEGTVELLTAEESDAYFATRDRGSQLSAWASPQSRTIESRSELEQLYAEREREFQNREVPRPPFWGGYRLVPNTIEFWEGRANRLHDRVRYELAASGWHSLRLAP